MTLNSSSSSDLALLATGRACVEVSLADRLRRLADLGDERLGRVALVDVLRPVDDDLRHADEVVAFVQRRRRELDVLFSSPWRSTIALVSR